MKSVIAITLLSTVVAGKSIYTINKVSNSSWPSVIWQPGSCNFNTSDKSIDISKIKQGNWFMYSNKHFSFYGRETHLDPFAVCSSAFYDFSCINIILTYLESAKELMMDYKCRQTNGPLHRYPKCRYYVNFMSNRRIKYEVAYKCDKRVGVDKVEIAHTNYKTFIIVRGCFEMSYDDEEHYQNVYNVLVQPEFSFNELREHCDIGDDKRTALEYFNGPFNASFISKRCDCEKNFCYKDTKCLPMEFINRNDKKGVKHFLFVIVSLPVIIAVVSFVMIKFIKFYETYKRIFSREVST